MRRVYYILYFLLLFTRIQAGNRLDLPVHEIHIQPGNKTEIQLPHTYIIPSDFTIYADSVVLDSAQYKLDALSGRITLLQKFPESQLVIRYQALPVSIPLTYRHFSVSDSIEFTGAEPDTMPGIPLEEKKRLKKGKHKKAQKD